MAILSALFNRNMGDYTNAFQVKDITSEEMKAAIKDCFDLYFSEEADYEDDSQRLPVVIVNKIAKTMYAEYDAKYEAESKDGFVTKELDELDAVKMKAAQYMLMGGECLLKPLIEDDVITWAPIRRDCFIPLGRDNKGRITAVGTAEFTIYDEGYYTLLERRSVENGQLKIETKLFRSQDTQSIGAEVPLNTLEKYTDLEPVLNLQVNNIGLVMMKTPILNDVDGSNDGVAVFEPARKLIRSINKNERQLDDEFELLQARIVVSADMIKDNQLNDKVFTGLDDNPEDVGIMPFSPAMREQSYLARKREYLRNVETLIGLKRGLLADVQEEERTATEITDSKGEYNLTIIDFQKVWTQAVKEACVLAGELGQIYGIAGAVEVDPDKISIDYGDGVLYNRDKQWAELQGMVAMGLLKPELALAWYYDLPDDTPADLENIRKNYMPDMNALAGEQGNEAETEEEGMPPAEEEPAEPEDETGESAE